jgi:hypothetical protein
MAFYCYSERERVPFQYINSLFFFSLSLNSSKMPSHSLNSHHYLFLFMIYTIFLCWKIFLPSLIFLAPNQNELHSVEREPNWGGTHFRAESKVCDKVAPKLLHSSRVRVRPVLGRRVRPVLGRRVRPVLGRRVRPVLGRRVRAETAAESSVYVCSTLRSA